MNENINTPMVSVIVPAYKVPGIRGQVMKWTIYIQIRNGEEGLLGIEEAPVKTYYSDEDIWHVITNLCGVTTAAEFQQLPRPQQKQYLWEAHEKGIGPRALSRLTGVPYSIVQRATSAENEKRLLSGMVCESTLEDEDWYSYCSPDEFEPYPEY